MKKTLAIAATLIFLGFFRQANADITTGLTGYWNFDEGSGASASDSSGNGKTGSLVNGPAWTTGKIGSGALSFDGMNDQVVVSGVSSSGEMSIAMWVRFADVSSVHRFFDRDGDVPILRSVDGAGIQFIGSVFQGGATTIQANQWYHIVAVGGASGHYIYVNGALDGSSATPYAVSGSAPIMLGGSLDLFAGTMDDVRIYSRALSASDVSQLYAYTSGGGGSSAPSDTTAPSAPSSLSASAISSTGINLSWTASTDAVGVVGYRIYRGGTQMTSVATNSYSDSGLSASTNYSYTVSAYDAAGNASAQSSSANATTQAGSQPSDTTPPTISSVSSGSVTSSGASISWATNESSDSQVEYGLTASYGNSTALNASMVTSHSASVSSLSASTLYHYRVKSRDAAGNLATGADNTFTTSAAAQTGSGSNFYIAQTALGSADASSCANAQSVSWLNTSGNWGSAASQIGPGETVHLCGTISTTLNILGSGSSGNPITILFESGAKLSKTAWGVDALSALYSSGKNYITIDGNGTGIIENTGNGDAFATKQASYGLTVAGCTGWEIKGLAIRNIYVHTYNTNNSVPSYSTRGIYAENCNNFSIHDNTITHAYVGIYDLVNGAALSNHNIYRNTVSNTSTAIIPALGGSSSDSFNILNVYDNDITMGLNWFDTPDDNHIDGIHVWTSPGVIRNMRVYGNYIHGDPSGHCTGYIFIEGNFVSASIYNNLLVGGPGPNHPMGGYISPGLDGGTIDIYNNTIVGSGNSNTGGIGINLYAPAGKSLTANIKNNIFSSLFIGVYDSDMANPNSVVFNSDYNDFHNVGSVGWRVSHDSTLSAWQASTGGDAHSISSNPALTGTFMIPSNSPAVNAGANLSSFFATDKNGNARPSSGAWDIGAYEYAGSGGGGGSSDTTAPSAPSSLSSSAITQTGATISWTASTDAVGVAGYKIYRGGSQIGTPSANSYTDSGLTAATSYSYTVAAYDAAGNTSAQSSALSVTTSSGSAPADTTAPAVSVSAPTNGSTVSGSISLAASASDNVGVIGVQFKLDGANLGSELTTSPYSGSWNTIGVSNGSHTLTAVARDAAGNMRTSSSVTVTVSNSVTPPADTSAPSTPTGLTPSSVTQTGVTLSWLAAVDNVGVSGYKVFRNGTQIASPTTNSYAVTGLSANTTYTFTASAYDATGNTSSLSLPLAITTAAVPVTTFALSASKSGTGTGTITGNGLNCGTTCSVSITNGTTVTLTATPSSDSIFSGWSGACTNATGTCVTTVTGAKSVSASFTIIPVVTPPVVAPPASGGGGGGSVPVSTPVTSSTGTFTPTVSQPSTPKPTGSISTGIILTKNLYVGLTDPEVTILQKYLIAQGYMVGTGTGYFGSVTEAAVMKYQAAKGITQTGTVGPLTRASLAGGAVVITVPTTSTSIPAFTRSLTIGTTGTDVKYLQIFLNKHGFQVSLSGAGSPNNETTTFGPATQRALAKFQLAKGISPAAGYFGPLTMKVVNSLR